MTQDTKMILKALRCRHPEREWAFFEELRAGTGYRNVAAGLNPEQRFDAWAINLYPSRNFVRIAYEIKVSRSDFLKEIKHPEKRTQALQMSNQFYFVAPVGLIKASELPPEAGLIEVKDEWESRMKVRAPVREAVDPTWQFFASIARRMQSLESRI
ncbi:hypothetical protein E4K67_22615 [Desulfosporosinus fructosivorans]|uniref:Uncharacterized protein n=1 Tax=Desulfosporosinus fructosivorans TaxID=2018669 RepID=A0A4Z0QYP7_9FIRM|nr:hypothetical protein [Desulfosporosinus fructosivorans]TGE35912.1 hypothetical protein E4K67_22615 [Desulfosporosinus fructosivorans]